MKETKEFKCQHGKTMNEKCKECDEMYRKLEEGMVDGGWADFHDLVLNS